MPEEEKQTPQNQNQNDNPKENKFQARINKLYGQKKEAEEYSANLETENQNLRSQMSELQEKVSALEGRSNVGDDQAGLENTGQQAPADGNAGNLNAELVKNIVQDTVGSILSQRDQQVQKQQQIMQAQQKSWRSAVEEMPALADKNSELYQAAQQIWEKDTELRASPAGPYKAVVMARGLLGPDGASQEKLNSVSMQSTIDQNLDSGNVNKAIQEIDTELAEISQKMANGEPIQRVWPRYKDLKAKKGELLKKQQK